MTDRSLRTHVHLLIKEKMRPIISDTIQIPAAGGADEIGAQGAATSMQPAMRLRAPQFARDALR